MIIRNVLWGCIYSNHADPVALRSEAWVWNRLIAAGMAGKIPLNVWMFVPCVCCVLCR